MRVGATAPTAAVLQMAPRLDEPTTVVLEETWSVGELALDAYIDGAGNRCHRVVVPDGPTELEFRARVRVGALPDPIDEDAREIPPGELPSEVLVYTMPSRYCLSDELAPEAYRRFGHLEPGWARVQAIFDDVHSHVSFRYGVTTSMSTAADVFRSAEGVCRDYTHLATSFCRAMNIPARYVMGYIPDIGIPPSDAPMDFCAWTEVFLTGGWHTFDARLNVRRIGRVPIARGRDAVDVAILTSFGQLELHSFDVVADEVPEQRDLTTA